MLISLFIDATPGLLPPNDSLRPSVVAFLFIALYCAIFASCLHLNLSNPTSPSYLNTLRMYFTRVRNFWKSLARRRLSFLLYMVDLKRSCCKSIATLAMSSCWMNGSSISTAGCVFPPFVGGGPMRSASWKLSPPPWKLANAGNIWLVLIVVRIVWWVCCWGMSLRLRSQRETAWGYGGVGLEVIDELVLIWQYVTG